MKNHLELLGYKVRDSVSGIEGVVSSICFDISGCIQGAVKLPAGKDGKMGESYWVDLKQLEKVSKWPVTAVSTYDVVPGSQAKPAFSPLPNK